MNRFLIVALACLAAPLASAELYKYVDKDGKTIYSDQPPINVDSRQLNIPSTAIATPASPAKSALDRDKDLQKGRDEARERAKKSEQAAKQSQAQEQACTTARENLRVYTDGGRVTRYDDKGERVFMDDQEIEAARVRSKREMDEACKKS